MATEYCGNCGAAVSTAARFCSQCGSELATQAAGSSLAPLRWVGCATAAEGEGVELGAVIALSEESRSQPLAEASPHGLSYQEKVIKLPSTLTTPPEPATTVRSALDRLRAWFNNLSVGPQAMEPVTSNRKNAARALAQASGLISPSGGLRRTVLIGLAILLAGCAFLLYRSQSLSSSIALRVGFNLIAPEEKSDQLVSLGEQALERGDYQAAIENFQQAIALTPNHNRATLRLARAYRAIGQWEDALRLYTRLLETDEKNLEARLERAELYRARSSWAEALKDYQRLIALDPTSQQAEVALKALDYTQERAADYAPLRASRHAKVKSARGVLLPASGSGLQISLPLPELTTNTLGRYPGFGIDEAAEERISAKALAQAHKEKGLQYSRAGQYVAAIKEFKTALLFTPEDKDIYYFIASAYHLNGQPAIAHEYYKKCDAGTYVSVARSGAQKTEKDARKMAEQKKDNSSQAATHEMMRSLN